LNYAVCLAVTNKLALHPLGLAFLGLDLATLKCAIITLTGESQNCAKLLGVV
jgi:hypothetical protein